MITLMLFTMLLMLSGIGVLIWIGCRRVAKHLRVHPEAMKAVIEHVLTPLLGETNVEAADLHDGVSLKNKR